jgi:hypothetical protein
MAWKFLNLGDPKTARKRADILERIDHWWEEFRTKTPDLDDLFAGRRKWDLPKWVHDHLQTINKRLMWEFGRQSSGHYLVITPEANKHLRPLVETILERAPRIEGWTFLAYRQPEPAELTRESVRAKTGRDLFLTGASARIGELHRIDLVYQSPADNEAALRQAFATTESLLGEEALDKWVGIIDVASSLKGARWLPLERLQGTVEALIASIHDQLPEQPCQDLLEGAEWTMLKGPEPDESDDYPGQDDLLLYGTVLPEMWESAHRDGSFYSLRYSRCGERFCYLKIDGKDGLDEEKFADRSAIEEALNAALTPDRLGCAIGGGTGLRYSYIDLALTNVERGSEIVRDVLREGNISRRTWLQFYDCEWQREWIGIWDDTPPPPRRRRS